VKKYVYVAVLVASLALATVSAAEAAPSISFGNVVSPTGAVASYPSAGIGATTWKVSLFDIGAWDNSLCESTAHFTANEWESPDVEGEDADPNSPWNQWSFKANTAYTYNDEAQAIFSPLARITASCELTRTVYLGKRAYRKLVEFHRSPPSTVSRRPGGCRVFSYSTGRLTIDCRHSRTSGSVTWMFGSRWSDVGGRYGIYWDRSQSTFGPHSLSSRWTPKRFYVTETVRPGTMITVTDVWETTKRVFMKKVYRHDKKVLTAAWPS
jgi:hypothetical protein